MWRLRPTPPAGYSESVGLPPFLAHLVHIRGIRDRGELARYLTPDAGLVHDPMLLPDMVPAVDRLLRAKRDGETVAVFGDFDVDGLSGTALLVETFSGLGVKSIPYIPDRVAEGHGLNDAAVTRLRDAGASVMVTVDCGVGSDDQVSLASTLGIDTVITDHHAIGEELPPAAAVVNPARSDSFYPHATLTGVGIALKLAQALYGYLGLPVPDRLFELASLGTVADVAPLTGENRYIVRTGLECMNRTDHPGLKAIIARAGLTPGGLDEESLSFKIIPRLNAAGRLGDASLSLRLLTASSPQEAAPLAAELERLNDERRVLSREAIDDALAQVGPFSDATPPVLVVESAGWKPGILGLVANSLAERYDRPAVAATVADGTCRASARSVPGFNIVEALEKNSGLLRRFGGHAQAAGFSMDAAELPQLKAGLEAVAEDAVLRQAGAVARRGLRDIAGHIEPAQPGLHPAYASLRRGQSAAGVSHEKGQDSAGQTGGRGVGPPEDANRPRWPCVGRDRVQAGRPARGGRRPHRRGVQGDDERLGLDAVAGAGGRGLRGGRPPPGRA